MNASSCRPARATASITRTRVTDTVPSAAPDTDDVGSPLAHGTSQLTSACAPQIMCSDASGNGHAAHPPSNHCKHTCTQNQESAKAQGSNPARTDASDHGRKHLSRDPMPRPQLAWPERGQAAPVSIAHGSHDTPAPGNAQTHAQACGPPYSPTRLCKQRAVTTRPAARVRRNAAQISRQRHCDHMSHTWAHHFWIWISRAQSGAPFFPVIPWGSQEALMPLRVWRDARSTQRVGQFHMMHVLHDQVDRRGHGVMHCVREFS